MFLDKLGQAAILGMTALEEGFVHTTFMSLMKAMRLLLKHFQVLSPENPLMSYGTEALICQA